MRLFDILGPVMVGPSSSHTAGAVRIGLTARKLLGDQPVHADISLHGSFALTGHGHGTDCALIAGLLGMQPDDLRIPGSFAIAAEQGLTFAFQFFRGLVYWDLALLTAGPGTLIRRTDKFFIIPGPKTLHPLLSYSNPIKISTGDSQA